MSAPRPRMPSNVSDANRTIGFERSDLGPSTAQDSQKHYLLICVQGLEVGKPVELGDAEVFVGRTPNNGIVLAHSQISRKHAQILWVNGHHTIEDLGSANGTFIGGIRVTTRTRLNPGDIVQFGSTFAFRYSIMDETEKSLLEQLYQTSVLDALTGAYNREYFNSALSTEIKQSAASSSPLSLLLLDLDHFKKINDTYGHSTGDAVLIELVNRIRLRLRPSDVLCRYGGEEFAVILRATGLDDATALAERFRQAVRKQKFAHGNECFHVTVSIGCASLNCCGDSVNDETLITIADRRLYAAKHAGRDRVLGVD